MKAVFQKTDDFGLTAKRIKNFKGFPPMFHSHLELIYVISGEISMNIDGHSHVLKEGELSVLFPYVVHSYENSPDAEIYIINYTRTHNAARTQELIDKGNTCLAALANYYGATLVDQAKNQVQYENCHLYGADEANPQALHPNLRGQAALAKLIIETMYEKLPK